MRTTLAVLITLASCAPAQAALDARAAPPDACSTLRPHVSIVLHDDPAVAPTFVCSVAPAAEPFIFGTSLRRPRRFGGWR